MGKRLSKIFQKIFSNKVLLPSAVSAGFISFGNVIAISSAEAWIALALIIVSLFGYKHAALKRDKERITLMFSKYLAREVLENYVTKPQTMHLGGIEENVTVLFADIRGFTAMSEQKTPKEVVVLLNRYFAAMTEEIARNNGLISKYAGDGLMAFWGAPKQDLRHADNALHAAIAMTKKLQVFNNELVAMGESPLSIGIGISTGIAAIGNIGSERRYEYTAIGDVVNIASRLQEKTKEYAVPLIVSETTMECLAEESAKLLTHLGTSIIRGRQKEISIFAMKEQEMSGALDISFQLNQKV